jgi:hypothetical protein
MTAREIYFKAYYYSNKSFGMIFYSFNENNAVCIGNTPWLYFNKENHEHNISIMENIEKNKNDFMFWNMSPESIEYNKRKTVKMKEVLSVLTFIQK